MRSYVLKDIDSQCDKIYEVTTSCVLEWYLLPPSKWKMWASSLSWYTSVFTVVSMRKTQTRKSNFEKLEYVK